MGAILVRVGNASRRPLDDRIKIEVTALGTDAIVASVSDVPGSSPVRIEGLVERRMYVVKVFPTRHRPVSQFVFAGTDVVPTLVQFHTPLDPEKVRAVTFPDYAALPPDLKRIVDCSTVDGSSKTCESLYTSLTDIQKAGLFNLFSKMSAFEFDEGRTVWSFVDKLFGVRPDRIFIDVQPELRDLVRDAVASGRFREVSGSLHEPPPGYGQAGSFKTDEELGNLQLTFFSNAGPPQSFKVDADIDDAAGLGHAFQVIRNWVTHGTTHPYDIHQILAFGQAVTLPYDLA